jgi:predicted Zn-dependent protease
MITARAQVLSNLGADALRSWQPKVDDAGFLEQPMALQAGACYGATLAAIRLRDSGLARRNLLRLQALVGTETPVQTLVLWLQAELELSAHDLPPQQLRAQMTSLGLAPTAVGELHRPALLLLAQASVAYKQPQELNTVAQGLQTWLAYHPQDALAWDWLTSIYAAQNQLLRSLRAQAEAQAARLDYVGAQDRLMAAQALIRASGTAGSSAFHIDASIIDTRLRQIQVLLKDQAQPG